MVTAKTAATERVTTERVTTERVATGATTEVATETCEEVTGIGFLIGVRAKASITKLISTKWVLEPTTERIATRTTVRAADLVHGSPCHVRVKAIRAWYETSTALIPKATAGCTEVTATTE